ncbi:MAG: 7,8-didemethyl-8-hydroxy-5-deazariboflavin synthase CofG, partial [Pyrinomonadaceae bacterium]
TNDFPIVKIYCPTRFRRDDVKGSSDLMEYASESFVNRISETSFGELITRQQAYLLIEEQREDEILMLMRAASRLRDCYKGNVVTFSKKVFIPLTNICRDYCGYCTFRKDPTEPGAHTMTPDEVIAIAEAGARLGCKEALFSLGDKPEAAFSEVRDELRKLGHQTTLAYLKEMCRRVLLETSLLPHSNPGLMRRKDLEELKPFNVSLGLMLETVSSRLMGPGESHEGAPDKHPRLRLRTIEEAGRQGIPFTTGILIGIGETLVERVDSLFAIRDLHRRYGHIQEVIIQNFRAKSTIPMCNHAEPSLLDLARTVAVARLIFGGEMNIQVPPNLSPADYPFLLGTGINDWGGISPLTIDHINPEAPWPHIERLRENTASAGFVLRERLAVYPEFTKREEFLSAPARERLESMSDEEGYARTN